MAELREVLEAGPVLILLPSNRPMVVVGAWAFQTENGLAWANPGFDTTPSQPLHFIEGTMEQTGEREWTWTTPDGDEFELTPSQPPISVDLTAEVDAWLAYRERKPEGTSREDARELLEQKLPELAGRVLV